MKHCCTTMAEVIRLDAHDGFPAGLVSQSMVDLNSKVGAAKISHRIAYRSDRGKKGKTYIPNWCPFCKTRLNKALYDKYFPKKRKKKARAKP